MNPLFASSGWFGALRSSVVLSFYCYHVGYEYFGFRVQAAFFVELQFERLFPAVQKSCSCLYAARNPVPATTALPYHVRTYKSGRIIHN